MCRDNLVPDFKKQEHVTEYLKISGKNFGQ